MIPAEAIADVKAQHELVEQRHARGDVDVLADVVVPFAFAVTDVLPRQKRKRESIESGAGVACRSGLAIRLALNARGRVPGPAIRRRVV